MTELAAVHEDDNLPYKLSATSGESQTKEGFEKSLENTGNIAWEDEEHGKAAVILDANDESDGQQIQKSGILALSEFEDHFTLSLPSSTVKYRGSNSCARVVEGQACQFVLEETYDEKDGRHHIQIRQVADTPTGVIFLQILYVTVIAFWTGFLFIFCLHILLFLALGLAVQLGMTSKPKDSIVEIAGSLLALPVFVHGLTSVIVIAVAFLKDAASGHKLMRKFFKSHIKPTIIEWILFSFFLGLPMLVMTISLFIDSNYWWKYTALTWLGSVGFFYMVFAISVITYEIGACWEATKLQARQNEKWFQHVKRIILLRQRNKYCGRRTIDYMACGFLENTSYTYRAKQSNIAQDTLREYSGWFSKVTQWKAFNTEKGIIPIFEVLEEEERLYTIHDARQARPFLTSHTWGFEKIFCLPLKSQYVAIIQGPDAITKPQMRSAILCGIIGHSLSFLLLLAVILYLEFSKAGTIIVIAAFSLSIYPSLSRTFAVYKLSKEYLNAQNAERNEGASKEQEMADQNSQEYNRGIYNCEEVYRITKPRDSFCWIMFIVEIVSFYFVPIVALINTGSFMVGLFFFVVVGISALRYYFNAATVLEETGLIKLVGQDESSESFRWKKQSRLNSIIGNITKERSSGMLSVVFGFLGFLFLGLMLAAVLSGEVMGTEEKEDVGQIQSVYLSDFEYVQANVLEYPTCQIAKFDNVTSPLSTMADFAFLSALAYQGTNQTQNELDTWFNGTATDRQDVVDYFRSQRETPSAVSFKLVTITGEGHPSVEKGSEVPPFAYVLIRGTTNSWDLLTDAQLWSAAALMQVHRALLPVGQVWTPIIDELIFIINGIESKNINKVAFYKDTGAFVNYLLAQTGDTPDDNYAGVAVTGHSLGGGLAIITGAQQKVPAVALSGPNAMLTSRSLNPPITPDDLDSNTFNIIPDRDPVAMVDDRARNFQEIRCNAAKPDAFACHDKSRSLCQILYTCGSGKRPVPCYCATMYGFPEPIPKPWTNRSFSEACGLR